MYSLIQRNNIWACRAIFVNREVSTRFLSSSCLVCSSGVNFTKHRVKASSRECRIYDYSVVLVASHRHPARLCQKRHFQTSQIFLYSEPLKPSSKVEESVQALKEARKQESSPDQTVKAVVVKKSWKKKVIDELVHYYHGFRLLFIDVNVSRKLLWKVLNGKSLTRREHKLLIRTVGDVFRIVPFSVFIIVPFLEFTLPFFIKFFPGMLPSTFQTATEREDKIKAQLKVKLEMAKFLQATLDELPVVSKGGHSSQSAKEFAQFFQKVRTSGGMTTTEEIMKFSKLFEDEITLDSLPRPQLMALCRVLEINPIGPTNVLRFQLRLKLRSLHADDLMIQKEGIESLSQAELQAACRARGMRALGVSEARLRAQLAQWLDLSINKKVPPTLLLLTQAFMLPDTIPTSEKLAQTISALPDTVGTRTQAVICEREGKVDNKTKIELIKEEVKAIREEKKELQEEAAKKAAEKAAHTLDKEELVDTAPTLVDRAPTMFPELRAAIDGLKKAPITENDISKKDIEAIETALDMLGKHRNDLMVEKEELEDLRQEMSEYQEDISDLEKVTRGASKGKQVFETKAAQRLFKKVNNMINRVDNILEDLEERKKRKPSAAQDLRTHLQSKASDGVFRVEELMEVLNNMSLDKTRLERITQVLSKIDTDKDGIVRLDTVLKIIEVVGTDNVPLNQSQLDDIISLVNKEEALELDEQIAKALKPKEEGAKSDKNSSKGTEEDYQAIDDMKKKGGMQASPGIGAETAAEIHMKEPQTSPKSPFKLN